MAWWVWPLIAWALMASVAAAWLTAVLAVRVGTLEALRAERDRHWATGEGEAPVLLTFGVSVRVATAYVVALFRRLARDCGARLRRGRLALDASAGSIR